MVAKDCCVLIPAKAIWWHFTSQSIQTSQSRQCSGHRYWKALQFFHTDFECGCCALYNHSKTYIRSILVSLLCYHYPLSEAILTGTTVWECELRKNPGELEAHV